MLRILLTSILLLSFQLKAEVKLLRQGRAPLKSDISKIFNHEKHRDVFNKFNLSCTECHSFSVKANDPGPLGQPIGRGFLKANQQSCHQCHLQKAAVGTPTQCILCHKNENGLKPEDHNLNWIKRHAFAARLDQSSCMECHQQNNCSECHFKRDQMNPKVHRGNFRLTHSIDARSNPASCVQCHQQQQFCSTCHQGVRR
ncbi:MAG: hypothetical protein OHK0056_10620 [Bacteriovoracaceae bacterium]